MNARLIISIYLLFPIVCCFAQSNLNNFYRDFLKEKRTNDFFKNVEGSQYEIEDFTKADVYLRGNDTARIYLLRYNNLLDEMEMKNAKDDNYLVVNNKELIDSIILNDEVYLFHNFVEENKPSKGFFIRLTTGKFSLLQRRTKEYIPERKPTGGYQEYIRPSIQPKPITYYLVTEKNNPELLPESMPGITRFFKNKGYDLSKEVKAKKLKYKEEHIIELIHLLKGL